ncbi:hypothetical protein [Streptomyces yaizuensis]|uniref:Uncharacterized protein n=1 Tax=Streptomyces yaizuensis TaxID=2989713 RepID=A0ABQ5P6X7_9ACTN|nr:hypothetical protein [Streptomyces sp. YSPA8]GLF98338.1 hypothetical protein SYYSPA8_28595 [Streptomyces sp. YSPA8]
MIRPPVVEQRRTTARSSARRTWTVVKRFLGCAAWPTFAFGAVALCFATVALALTDNL